VPRLCEVYPGICLTTEEANAIQFVFQVTQKDLRSSLMMAGYCRNMPVYRIKEWYKSVHSVGYFLLRPLSNSKCSAVYISNKVLHTYLYSTYIHTYRYQQLEKKFSVKYRDKIPTHPNELASAILEEEEPRRLKIFKPTDLTTRFSQTLFHRFANM
jgi:hypothetical protein